MTNDEIKRLAEETASRFLNGDRKAPSWKELSAIIEYALLQVAPKPMAESDKEGLAKLLCAALNKTPLTLRQSWEQLEQIDRDSLMFVATSLTSLRRNEGKCEFHPLKSSDLLSQAASSLPNYRVEDMRSRQSYVSQRLLHVALLTYLKHVNGRDVIGWDALGDELQNVICEAIGDDEFCKWLETTSKA